MLLPAVTLLLATMLHPVAQPTPGEIARRIDALSETGRVLYVAAHPDDENTRFLAWAANGAGYDAAYLSLTRGDGGQNLIGDEQSPLLGVIRTWELLSARSTDGAVQFIGSARDFGYSKSADETLDVWGEDETLGDVVAVIRRFRPHVIVTRFPEEGSTHGHHLASARLARLAFDAAADPDAYPEQLDELEPWQATRVVHNVPTWGGLPEDADTSEWIGVDVGDYQPLLGRSFGEIAAASRSMHRSQGFGAWASRGEAIEWFSHVAGEQARDDLFEGVDTSWDAVDGGADVSAALQAAAQSFDVGRPQAAIPDLLDALEALDGVDDPALAATARAELSELVVACAGLVLDARAESAFVPVGGEANVTWSALLRAESDVRLDGIDLAGVDVGGSGAMTRHAEVSGEVAVPIDSNASPSAPYWLARPVDGGRYDVRDPALLGAPVDRPPLVATFRLSVGGQSIEIERPVRHVSLSPTLGERVTAVEVMPPVTLTPLASVRMMPGEAAEVALEARAFADVADALVRLDVPDGWTVTPDEQPLSLAAGERATVRVTVQAPEGASRASAVPVVEVDGRSWSWRGDELDHEHLPPQTVLRPASIDLQPVELAPYDGVVGYVMGPGDLVAASLAEVGVAVRMLSPDELTPATLAELDALLIGIRAYNTHPDLHERLDDVLAWVETGGVLVTQYQTNNRLSSLSGPIGPADIEIGRGRVTQEDAAVTLLQPDHAAFNAPHALTDADWDGWVQERGLYFATTWDDAWTPLVAWSDDGEAPLEGSLLVAEHGDGVVVYTGISLFRQLPAGVPGAYRLLLNLLSLGGTS